MTSKTSKNRRKTRNGTRKITKNKKGGNDMKPRCSPANPEKQDDFTCYSDDSLNKMKELWNVRHPNDKIKSSSAQDIWVFFKNKFSNTCENEKCWMRQQFAKNNLSREMTLYTFAPDAPSTWDDNPNEWLTSTELSSVMSHFEKKHPNFLFIGPTPIDFDSVTQHNECVWDEMCSFSIPNLLKKRKHKIGIIYNTDPHTEDGEHWIASFIDLKPKNGNPFHFHFDSNGDPPKKEIKAFQKRLEEQASSINMQLEFDKNHPFEHQYGESECGMYTLYFIINMLNGKHDAEYFKTKRIPDKFVEKYRNIYFN
uniref:Ubiquitin-like protease family profile domain-containing protein n=1 Tax=viral metagenome TaxID=1070528 RepID=A0A6C0CQ02_9ZZZZ